jgi:hypothetical protein
MSAIRGLESLELDLTRAGARLRKAGYDPRRTRRRLWWSEYGPIAGVVVVALAGLGALGTGQWLHVACVLLVLLPRRIERWQTRRQERADLLLQDDFLERERALLERRAGGERTLGLLMLGLGALFAGLAWLKDGSAPGLWFLAALLAGYALVRLALVGPALNRELVDLGGEPVGGWIYHVLVAVLIALAPFLLLFGIVRRAVRRLRGLPEEVDE